MRMILFVLGLVVSGLVNGQTINTVAGNGIIGFSGDGGLANVAKIECGSIAFDKYNNMYISGSYRIRKVDAITGIITTIAGNGIKGYNGDGGLALNAGFQISATANNKYATGQIAIDTFGNIYYSDSGRIRKIDYQTNIITTIAGNGSLVDTGDGGLAVDATIRPSHLVVDKTDNLIIACNLRVRKINLSTNIITTIIGDGKLPYSSGGTSSNPKSIAAPSALTIDTANNLFCFTSGNAYILKYFSKIDSFSYIACQSADVGCDNLGNLYLSNYGPSSCTGQYTYAQIYKWSNNQSSPLKVIAGTTTKGFSGDGGLAINAKISIYYYASNPICDKFNNVYFYDYGNNRIRKIILQPLPLKLLSFNARQQTTNSLALNWQTANEINVSHINIQRSINSKDFTSIGKVNASCCSYEFTDSQLPTVTSQLYYRLEIIDKDGSKTYSEVKQINFQHPTSNIVIYPNPAKDNITIGCNGAKELMIIDYLGRTIKQFNNPTEHQTLNTKQFTKGVYLIKAIMANGAIKTEKLMVE